MSTEVIPATPEEVTEPIVDSPIVEEVPEQVYEFQPKDESGRPLGGKQVIKYRTHEELVQRLTDQNIQAVRHMRELNRKIRLGVTEAEELPTEAVRFNESPDFTAHDMTAEERVQLSRDLLDPEKFEAAADRMLEARLGAKPQVFRETLTRVQEQNNRILAKVEADAFTAANPDYYKCRENFETLTGWMVKNDLAPLRANFQLAYDKLTEASLLLDAPVPEAVPVQVPVTVTEPIPAPSPTPAAPRQTVPPASGLNNRQASNVPTVPTSVGDEIVFEKKLRDGKGNIVGTKRYTGKEAIDNMSSDEYKRRLLTDKTFGEKVERIEKADAERRKAARAAR